MVEHEVVSRQRRKVDPMVRLTKMMKDLQQEIRLLKEGRTQEIRDNASPLVNQERPQLEGGSAVEGGPNPQYLTLVDVMPFLNRKGRSS